MVLKELKRLNSYTHKSPFVILPIRHFALIFNYFRKSGRFIYYSKYGVKRGYSIGNDFLGSRSCLLEQNLGGLLVGYHVPSPLVLAVPNGD